MIPKKLQYCWFGEGPKSALDQRCMATWHEVLHDYELREGSSSRARSRGVCRTRPGGGFCPRSRASSRSSTAFARLLPQVDLFAAERKLCGADPADVETFHRGHFGATETPALSWEQLHASRPLFLAWQHVILVARHARDARRARQPEAQAELQTRARECWAEAERPLALAGAPGPS